MTWWKTASGPRQRYRTSIKGNVWGHLELLFFQLLNEFITTQFYSTVSLLPQVTHHPSSQPMCRLPLCDMGRERESASVCEGEFTSKDIAVNVAVECVQFRPCVSDPCVFLATCWLKWKRFAPQLATTSTKPLLRWTRCCYFMISRSSDFLKVLHTKCGANLWTAVLIRLQHAHFILKEQIVFDPMLMLWI